jgi:hypothetical protein
MLCVRNQFANLYCTCADIVSFISTIISEQTSRQVEPLIQITNFVAIQSFLVCALIIDDLQAVKSWKISKDPLTPSYHSYAHVNINHLGNNSEMNQT